jgi:hypothetical protein
MSRLLKWKGVKVLQARNFGYACVVSAWHLNEGNGQKVIDNLWLNKYVGSDLSLSTSVPCIALASVTLTVWRLVLVWSKKSLK